MLNPMKKKQCYITSLPPITVTSLQQLLSSVHKVAVVERFDCSLRLDGNLMP